MKTTTVLLALCAALFTGCATPNQCPPGDAACVEAERQKQLELWAADLRDIATIGVPLALGVDPLGLPAQIGGDELQLAFVLGEHEQPVPVRPELRLREASRNQLGGLEGVERMVGITRIVAQQNQITTTAPVAALYDESGAMVATAPTWAVRRAARFVSDAERLRDRPPPERAVEVHARPGRADPA